MNPFSREDLLNFDTLPDESFPNEWQHALTHYAYELDSAVTKKLLQFSDGKRALRILYKKRRTGQRFFPAHPHHPLSAAPLKQFRMSIRRVQSGGTALGVPADV